MIKRPYFCQFVANCQDVCVFCALSSPTFSIDELLFIKNK